MRMKRFLSFMIVGFLLANTVPMAFAALSDEHVRLMTTQRKIRQELRNTHGSRLSDLQIELKSIQKSLRELRLRQREERRQLRLNPVSIAIPPVTISEASVAPQLEFGKASYYADMFNGRKTASGEIFSNSGMTAAHRTLPFGTKVRVTNPGNGNTIEVVINDRGPHVAGRIIDLTSAAFSALDNLSRGVIDVQVEVIE